jgi:hypothetical protein
MPPEYEGFEAVRMELYHCCPAINQAQVQQPGQGPMHRELIVQINLVHIQPLQIRAV